MIKIKKNQAFTLVELLVVISIIALLLSILMPSLNKVRMQARLITDAANCKQIGQFMIMYQSEYNGAVPVVFNRFLANDPSVGNVAAKHRLISVALAAYDPQTSKLGSSANTYTKNLNPDLPWVDNANLLKIYYQKYLPKQYCCPFSRGTKTVSGVAGQLNPGSVVIGGRQMQTQTTSGYRDTFSSWRWFYPAGTEWFAGHPLGKPHGVQKFGSLPWNRQQENADPSQWISAAEAIKKPIKWNSQHFKRVGAGSPAEATVLFCDQGQYDNYSNIGGGAFGIFNYGSHKKASIGGTNAIFADSHVDWVPGTQIGWP